MTNCPDSAWSIFPTPHIIGPTSSSFTRISNAVSPCEGVISVNAERERLRRIYVHSVQQFLNIPLLDQKMGAVIIYLPTDFIYVAAG